MIVSQSRLLALAKGGCYYLSLYAASKGRNVLYSDMPMVLELADALTRRGLIDDHFYVKDAIAVLRFLGAPVNCCLYNVDSEGLIRIEHWVRECNNEIGEHFIVRWKEGSVYDPYGNSTTVALGRLKDVRVFK